VSRRDPQWHVFVSYRWVEPDMSWVRRQLVPALESAGLEVCVDYKHFPLGCDTLLAMSHALENSRYALCVLSPEYFEGNRATLFEALQARHRDLMGAAGTLIPLVLRPTSLPSWMSGLLRLDWTDAERRDEQWRRLLVHFKASRHDAAPPEPATGQERDGLAPAEVVFDPARSLPGEEFAVELLTRPLHLSRTPHGGICLAVDRDDVVDALYTTQAKARLCEEIFNTEERLAEAQRLETEIHRFLLGRSEAPSLTLHLDNLPLRWASGGVLSIIQWRGRRWTPFFFRDIPPYGWNLSLGHSDKGDDLNAPWTSVVREFLEEMFVLSREPRIGEPIDYRRFVLEYMDVASETRKAEHFAERILNARRRDGLILRMARDPTLLGSRDRRFTIVASLLKQGKTEVLVSKGLDSRRHSGVLVAINPLELGIEVLVILEWTLDEEDSILDGEILATRSGDQLVRMPLALISHDYLSQVFGPTQELRYSRGIQHHVEAPGIPAGALHVFPFDLLRRRELATDSHATPWERVTATGSSNSAASSSMPREPSAAIMNGRCSRPPRPKS
jgi:hypothetical protein